MEKYSKKYMENHCIDLFFICGIYPIHVLTAGSIIPDGLNDIFRNRTLQENVEKDNANMPVLIDDAYINSVIEKHYNVVEGFLHAEQLKGDDAVFQAPSLKQIASRFLFYARKGFYSYDCSELKEDGTAEYKLVAWPEKGSIPKFNLPEFHPKGFDGENLRKILEM